MLEFTTPDCATFVGCKVHNIISVDVLAPPTGCLTGGPAGGPTGGATGMRPHPPGIRDQSKTSGKSPVHRSAAFVTEKHEQKRVRRIQSREISLFVHQKKLSHLMLVFNY